MAIDESQQMVLGEVVFRPEVAKQRLRTVVLTHHDQKASENGDEQQHQRERSTAYNVPAIAFSITNSVTFSTATGFANSNQ